MCVVVLAMARHWVRKGARDDDLVVVYLVMCKHQPARRQDDSDGEPLFWHSGPGSDVGKHDFVVVEHWL